MGQDIRKTTTGIHFQRNLDASLISIVIPCYNDYQYIEQAVDSVLAQTWPYKEIIVVDDGSNKLTRTKLRSLDTKIDKLISQENRGVSAARNRGVQAAVGEFVLVLDSDDFFNPGFCEKAITVFKNNKEVKLVTCYSNWFDDIETRVYKPDGGKIEDCLLKNVAMGSAMFKKQDWDLVGGYDEKMVLGYEDWEFYIRLLKTSGFAYVIPEILFNYRNKINSRNKKANLVKYNILEYIYNKHADLYKQNFALFIRDWLDSIEKSEMFKQQVMDSMDYKVGNKILKPFRFFGFFKKNKFT